jgi:hypothetical protein
LELEKVQQRFTDPEIIRQLLSITVPKILPCSWNKIHAAPRKKSCSQETTLLAKENPFAVSRTISCSGIAMKILDFFKYLRKISQSLQVFSGNMCCFQIFLHC